MSNTKIRNSIIWSVILMIAGIIILLSSLDILMITNIMYVYIVISIIAIMFHIVCFISKPKKYSLLVPGGMFLVCSALLFTCEYSATLSMIELWPVIILSVAFGMLEQKVFSKGEQGTWVTIAVVTIIGLFFLVQNNFNFGVSFGVLLIIIGIVVAIRLIRKLPKQPKKEEDDKFADI